MISIEKSFSHEQKTERIHFDSVFSWKWMLNSHLDIDECQDPSIAARCVENAECCNLPAHFVCKCKPGYEGDGEEQCTDINECLNPGACGINTDCINTPGNHTCVCRNGYEGSPFDGCVDINECLHPNACGPGAICINLDGSYQCECPKGYDGDARTTGCRDFDECARLPCGRNAMCRNSEGSFQCLCPEGFIGDPMNECQGKHQCEFVLSCIKLFIVNAKRKKKCQVNISQTIELFQMKLIFFLLFFQI